MAEQAPKPEQKKDRNLLWWSLGIVAVFAGLDLLID